MLLRYSLFDIRYSEKSERRCHNAASAHGSAIVDFTITEAKNAPAAASYRGTNGTLNPVRVTMHGKGYAQPKCSAAKTLRHPINGRDRLGCFLLWQPRQVAAGSSVELVPHEFLHANA